jgi:hypothetical protein
LTAKGAQVAPGVHPGVLAPLDTALVARFKDAATAFSKEHHKGVQVDVKEAPEADYLMSFIAAENVSHGDND